MTRRTGVWGVRAGVLGPAPTTREAEDARVDAEIDAWTQGGAGVDAPSREDARVDAEFYVPSPEPAPLPLRLSSFLREDAAELGQRRRRSRPVHAPPGTVIDDRKLRIDAVFGPGRIAALQVAAHFARQFGEIRRTLQATPHGALRGLWDVYVAFAREEDCWAAVRGLDGRVLQEGLFPVRAAPAWCRRREPPLATRLRVGPLHASSGRAAVHVARRLLRPFGGASGARAVRSACGGGYYDVCATLPDAESARAARDALHGSCIDTPRPVGKGLELTVDPIQ